jgi:hypothetical protein
MRGARRTWCDLHVRHLAAATVQQNSRDLGFFTAWTVCIEAD